MKEMYMVDCFELAKKVAYVERMMKSIDGKKKATITEEELNFLDGAERIFEGCCENGVYVDYHFFTEDEEFFLRAYKLIGENELIRVTCFIENNDIVHHLEDFIVPDWDGFTDCKYHAENIPDLLTFMKIWLDSEAV